ncbi:MAG: SpoIIE family protein phosphatase [candidate division Zixibacteria bacterium]|nr:SpoIIE family protein phosphatase [candidate division Zixibacteria bacterium]
MLSHIEEQIRAFETKLYDIEDEPEKKSMQLEDVATMGLMITSLLDIEKVLSAMMEMAIRMVSGEVGCIMLRDNGSLQTKISWGPDDSAIQSIKMKDDIDVATWTYQTGETTVINEFPESETSCGNVQALIAVPLTARDKHIGVLIVVNKISGGPFTDDDQMMLETLVRFAAVAIENASLLEKQLKQQKLEQEMTLARQVQQALLPARSEALAGAIIETVYRPAGPVGGDYFDIIKLSGHEFMVIVGNVSNKGMPAALMMAVIRSVFRMEMGKNIEIHQQISDLNTFLCDQVLKTENMFISLTYAYFNLHSRSCTYVNAGHLPPIHYSTGDSDIKLWKTGGIILGQFPDFQFKSDTVKLKSGDKILFYTDGISECEDGHGGMYGRERLHQFVVAHGDLPTANLLQKILADVDDYATDLGDVQTDDITALLVEIQ